MRNDPGTVTIPQNRFKKTKQRTLSRQGLPLVVNSVSCWVRSKRKRRASDVVKVEGEDPATPGCLRGDKVRIVVGNSQRNKMS